MLAYALLWNQCRPFQCCTECGYGRPDTQYVSDGWPQLDVCECLYRSHRVARKVADVSIRCAWLQVPGVAKCLLCLTVQ
jgi:hypothetical protein